MDHDLFDRLAVSLATRETPGLLTRRAAGAATALALALGLGGLAVDDAEARSCRNKCKQKNTKKKRRRCRKKCKNKQKCKSNTDCGNCEACSNGKCVAQCPADRCITDPSGDVCCPDGFIACGLACCGDTTPICASPGTCTGADGTCPGGACTGGPGAQGTCASATCNCNGDPGLCVTCLTNGVACTVDDECCGVAVCCPGAGNTCQAVCI